jgi:hypothetical protein
MISIERLYARTSDNNNVSVLHILFFTLGYSWPPLDLSFVYLLDGHWQFNARSFTDHSQGDAMNSSSLSTVT